MWRNNDTKKINVIYFNWKLKENKRANLNKLELRTL